MLLMLLLLLPRPRVVQWLLLLLLLPLLPMLPLLQPLVLLRGRGVPIRGPTLTAMGMKRAIGRRPKGIVGLAQAAELERAAMATEIADV